MSADLTCPDCGTVYAAGPDEPWRCACGAPLEFADRPLPEDPSALELEPGRGLWNFEPWLPLEERVTLGEGFTPLVDAPGWDAAFKLEYVFPTGSFKDRGATTTLSRAAELGVDRVLEDSSGNAGAAVATYAARAGIDAEIYVPADVKSAKLGAIERTGARPVRVEGSRQAVTDACIEAVEGAEDDPGDAEANPATRQPGAGWYASHAWNPAFYAGTMTFAFEIAAQRGWTAPDAVVLPVGHGTLFLGAYRGFSLLYEGGVIDEIPRLLGGQEAGCAPIADAVGDGTATDPDEPSVADGIRIAEPVRLEEIREAIERTDGDVLALEPSTIEDALGRLHRGGFYVEPTSAVAPAALERYRERGVLARDADVVVPLTGSGLKIE
ncbi:pyridoxal-phosphate dependent enzyme [Natronococcus jeotgali]|uniref:Pyridoxal-5'-phosphate-dependent protein beta subunit n=1 Tax=Natronococcus jeotgali DSM 18795 TaxID=1227498 RepID=L9XW40_9EURY|nr:pyridoxal-phosphate dependent enzyme [Natronococcus jeotgali]ELY65641.1 Pyridoxal-5'-phosphate-dependent protein beta subunit [Natronococcus jeotgali DSM 18795]